MAKLRYFDAAATKAAEAAAGALSKSAHSEFLRTGHISRRKDDWLPAEKRYMSYEEVAEQTGRKLQSAGDVTHSRINGFHRSIRFPKLLFHRTLEDSPHLGYCHVTAAKTHYPKLDNVVWAFYIANFYADIGEGEAFFEKVNLSYSRMYFAVAIGPEKTTGKVSINREINSGGLLFRTPDPKTAMKNVLMLGARSSQLLKIIRSL